MGSFVNLISYETFKVPEIPEKKLVPHNLQLTTFALSSFTTKGHVYVDLQIGPLRATTNFYMIDADVSYHMLLGRPWIHKNYAIPSILYQRLKAIKGKKEILIPSMKAHFSQEEVYQIEATFFDDISDELIKSRPRRVALTIPEETTSMEVYPIDQKSLQWKEWCCLMVEGSTDYEGVVRPLMTSRM